MILGLDACQNCMSSVLLLVYLICCAGLVFGLVWCLVVVCWQGPSSVVGLNAVSEKKIGRRSRALGGLGRWWGVCFRRSCG